MSDISKQQLSEAEIRQLARRVVSKRGANAAAHAFGITRQTILSLAAGAPVLPGTLALVRERLAATDPEMA